MGRAFEYRKATKLKRWGHMAKTFTKIGKQIAIAVKAGGPDPDMNPALRAIIANAKRENMPKDNIERAIKNAMGKDQSDYKEVNYEGYGPHGIAIFVETLTDNTTRTVGDVRSVFNKFSGNLGTQGSLSFLFDHKAVFTFKKKDGLDMDEMILDLIDYGVEDEFDEDEEDGRNHHLWRSQQLQRHSEAPGGERLRGDRCRVHPHPQRPEGRDTRAARGHRQDGGETGGLRRCADRLYQHETKASTSVLRSSLMDRRLASMVTATHRLPSMSRPICTKTRSRTTRWW